MSTDNSSRKILLLSPFFYPEQISTGKYNSYLACALRDSGCDVEVVCSYPLYPDWQPKAADDNLDGIRAHRGGYYVYYTRYSLVRRAVLELWFGFHVLRFLVLNRRKYDYVIPIFPPSLFFILATILMPRKTLRIGIVHDLQGVYAGRKGFLGRLINAVIRVVERACFRACDQLIFLSHAMRDKAVQDYGLDESAVAVCYPFVAIAEHEEAGNDLSDILRDDRINVVYSGALGEKQNPKGLYEFMRALMCRESRISCHIFSDGPNFNLLMESADPSDGVAMHSLVEASQLSELYLRSSIQILPQAAGTSDGSLPSKLPNLLCAGVPIFAICDVGSEAAVLIEETHGGVVAYSWDAEALCDYFLASLGALCDERREERRFRQEALVREKFSVEHLVAKIFIP